MSGKVCNQVANFVSIAKSLKIYKKRIEKSEKLLIFEAGDVIINV